MHVPACMEGFFARLPDTGGAADAAVHPVSLLQPESSLSLMPVTGTLHCRGWDVLGWLRQEAYTGPAHYATENGEAGSAADDVREHWARRQVRRPSLFPGYCLTVVPYVISLVSCVRPCTQPSTICARNTLKDKQVVA